MAVIDYEAAWFALKARIQEKRSHGSRDLAEAMAEIEVECRLDESQAGFDDRPHVSRTGEATDPREPEAVAESSHGDAARAA